jgi:hypothetical protein
MRPHGPCAFNEVFTPRPQSHRVGIEPTQPHLERLSGNFLLLNQTVDKTSGVPLAHRVIETAGIAPALERGTNAPACLAMPVIPPITSQTGYDLAACHCPRRVSTLHSINSRPPSTHPALRLTTLSPFGFGFVGLDADACTEDSGEDADCDLDHGCSFSL